MIEEILSLPRHDESSKETGLNRIKRKRMISSIMTGFFYAGAFGAALLLTIFVAVSYTHLTLPTNSRV